MHLGLSTISQPSQGWSHPIFCPRSLCSPQFPSADPEPPGCLVCTLVCVLWLFYCVVLWRTRLQTFWVPPQYGSIAPTFSASSISQPDLHACPLLRRLTLQVGLRKSLNPVIFLMASREQQNVKNKEWNSNRGRLTALVGCMVVTVQQVEISHLPLSLMRVWWELCDSTNPVHSLEGHLIKIKTFNSNCLLSSVRMRATAELADDSQWVPHHNQHSSYDDLLFFHECKIKNAQFTISSNIINTFKLFPDTGHIFQ